MVTVMAFSNALRVRMSRGVMPCFTSSTTAAPARRQSSSLFWLTASCAELLGSDKPSASIADAMVLAVYMPPQLPGPGIAVRSTSSSSSTETRDRHGAGGHVLVASADGDEAIEAFRAHHGLDRVCDDFARHQRVTHAG